MAYRAREPCRTGLLPSRTDRWVSCRTKAGLGNPRLRPGRRPDPKRGRQGQSDHALGGAGGGHRHAAADDCPYLDHHRAGHCADRHDLGVDRRHGNPREARPYHWHRARAQAWALRYDAPDGTPGAPRPAATQRVLRQAWASNPWRPQLLFPRKGTREWSPSFGPGASIEPGGEY